MNEQIAFGSVSRTTKLDDHGSQATTTLSSKEGKPLSVVRIDYSIRHRIEDEADEKNVYDTFHARQKVYTLFDTGISYEGKNRLKPDAGYYMVERFTMYKKAAEHAHIHDFIENEKKQLGL